MTRAVLVNGVPASGKSTVTRQLTRGLEAQGIAAMPFCLDTVKEGLFAQIGTGDREYNRKLGRASYHAIFNLIAEMPGNFLPVIDAWHGFQPESVLRDHLARAGIQHLVEVWVAIPPEEAARRYRARADSRHVGHLPASYADELFALAGRARPLALGTVIKVDGSIGAPDDLARRVREELQILEST
ncbi:ATP-binding protein [Paracoccus aurantiacus]|uniref:ATP-binding protein n=1 Tax=Paracoccus aurantiacus TaxID=2599412 RepID=A0A5C6RUG8_9RHOB|nr:AAA family ATPase [Paracoccus aurantiacus]TXB65644.1 ATP-binding protein [Paracoccus aurantiacus]